MKSPLTDNHEVRGESEFPILRTIKYSGNKTRLLPAITWLTNQIVKPGRRVFDLMAGSHCVGYALKQKYEIYANDIQEYSHTIGKAFIENGGYSIDRKAAEKELLPRITRNRQTRKYDLFQKTYANTYFTDFQCSEIDSIRGAIDNAPSPRKELYLTLLMSAMCYASNTTGHFAEFLGRKPTHARSVQERFFQKCENVSVIPSTFKNVVFNRDYKDFLLEKTNDLAALIQDSDLVYLDPPYSSAQYSRFYHVLETLVKYDYPQVEFKGLYRKDRHFSDFCRKSAAQGELEFALRKCGELCNGFVLLSYVDSKSCLIPKKNVEEIVQKHFVYFTRPLTYPVSHSRLGNGASKEVTEYLILATNSKQGKDIISKL
jgi:adenine-specific DNA-methyltransferase